MLWHRCDTDSCKNSETDTTREGKDRKKEEKSFRFHIQNKSTREKIDWRMDIVDYRSRWSGRENSFCEWRFLSTDNNCIQCTSRRVFLHAHIDRTAQQKRMYFLARNPRDPFLHLPTLLFVAESHSSETLGTWKLSPGCPPPTPSVRSQRCASSSVVFSLAKLLTLLHGDKTVNSNLWVETQRVRGIREHRMEREKEGNWKRERGDNLEITSIFLLLCIGDCKGDKSPWSLMC